MEHIEGKFTGQKAFSLYYEAWLPPEDLKTILLVSHGWAEYSGRYANLVNHFVPKGYAVYGLDHRGHGKSEGLRGYVERFSEYLDDLKTFYDIVHGKHADTKIFLIGHSMGGAIATAYTVRHQNELAGLILSGAVLKIPAGQSPLLIAAARMLSILLPKMGVKRVLDASGISRDKSVVDAYVNDPLVYRGKIRARFAAEILKAVLELSNDMTSINIPILIMHGTADRLSDPQGSRMLFERVGSNDRTLKLYEGFYHEIFNEPDHLQVMSDVENWLTARL